MSVLPYKYECPVDNVIIDMCAKVAPLFHATNHTANFITFEGAIASGYSLYLLANYRLKEFAFFYALGYIFDCLDGHYARRYKMVSKFGEIFEHLKDFVTSAGLFYVLITRYQVTPGIVQTFIVAGLGLLIHMGHQQKYLKSSGTILDPLQKLATDVKNMKYTRWLGCGTFMLLSIAVPFFLKRRYVTF